MKKLGILLLIGTLLLGVVGCAKKEDVIPENTAIEVVDMAGNTVTFEKPVETIVSLSPSNTEILFALGLGDKIVGVTEYCNYPEEALSKDKIGGFTDPNVELIKQLNPDVIVAAGSMHENFNNMDMKIVSTEASNFTDIAASVRLIGKITGTEAKAEELVAKMEKEIAEIQVEAIEALSEKPNVFYVVWDDPLTTAGNNTFINDVIKTAGANNVGEKVEGWAQYSTEQLLVDDIDMIIFATHSRPEQITLESVQAHPIYSKLDCVKNGNVHIMSNDDIIARSVPRVTEGIREIFEAIK